MGASQRIGFFGEYHPGRSLSRSIDVNYRLKRQTTQKQQQEEAAMPFSSDPTQREPLYRRIPSVVHPNVFEVCESSPTSNWCRFFSGTVLYDRLNRRYSLQQPMMVIDIGLIIS
mmetsp:Transcript_18365/g.42366  ORF Transcript_18365/g.42366 Transcript_18365/m.42366 type:complete len:114 (-) Transcript_18365:12-353(-)